MNLVELKERIRLSEERLQRRKWEYERNEEALRETQEQLMRIRKEIEDTSKEKELLFQASEWARSQSLKLCSEMVTNALQYILQKDVKCEASITERYGKPYLDFIVTSTENGNVLSGLPENSRGGGLWEIMGIILQIVLDRQGPFIIDEKARGLSDDYVPALYSFLKEMCRNLGCQIIVATHVPHLIESGDRIFYAIRPGHFEQRDLNETPAS